MSKISIEDLRKFAEEYVASEPIRQGIEGWWQTPLLASSNIALFYQYMEYKIV